MNNIQIFNNEDFGYIRTLMINEQPWFVRKDVVDMLTDTLMKKIREKMIGGD